MVVVGVREKLKQESIIYSVIKKWQRSKRIATFYTKKNTIAEKCANVIHNVCRVELDRL